MNFRIIIMVYLCLFSSVSIGDEVTKDSVYQLDSPWLNQNAEEITLNTLQGSPQLVSFVYTYCEHTCPLIIAQLKLLLRDLPEKDKENLKVTLISLDPERDQPKQLKAYMEKHHLDDKQWTMLNGHPDDVRMLSNLFNVRYKPMQDDQLAHSNMITLLDQQGVIQYQLKGLNQSKQDMVAKISALSE